MPSISAVVKQVFIVWLLLPFILTAFSVHAVDSIKVNTYTDYPPYLYYQAGQQTGLYMGIVDLTFKAINQPYSVKILPFKRGIYQAELGDGIMIAVLKTAQRMQTLDFSEPYYQERISVYSNQQKQPLIKTVDKLSGLNIGTLLGWSYGAKFDQAKANNRFFTHDSKLETNFYLLAKGRLDAVIHSELSAAYVLDKLGLKDKIFLVSKPLALGNIHLAVKKGTHKELLVRINKKLSEPEHIKAINLLIKNYQE
ncbi:substrate-binding periplasmic protein [Colwellia psychrerythraea]|uniref:ABC-type transporter, periplasmic subunit family 3 n=1 Tax=Colwellia psychrerythraea TaxID=28229 RepID=A0A099KN69_COLPS|nr:transporter substrate-binding domain-containing protein [Colwellia psychrerythraea]KGJ91926.1 ABC-type transporter, periplasmic subunit family 3 [Colwellia psychrerythraea]